MRQRLCLGAGYEKAAHHKVGIWASRRVCPPYVTCFNAMTGNTSIWLPVAFLAPCLWALVSVLDLLFVQGAYRDEIDGSLISGSFQILPWALVPLGLLTYSHPPAKAILLALAGGCLFFASYFFYFRSMFRYADAALIHVIWNMAALVVPLFAWAWSNEKLQPIHYLGIALAVLGSTLFVSRRSMLRNGFVQVAGTMFWAVILLSASMILQKDAYKLAEGRFVDIFLVFCLGVVLATLLLAATRPRDSLSRFRRIFGQKAKYVTLFVFAELASLTATVCSQRAIDLAPTPSFVAAVESTVPVFVMLHSLIVAYVLSRTGNGDASILFKNQLLGWREKIAAMSIMTVAIYLIAG